MAKPAPATGNLLPLIGYGTWPLAGEEALRCVTMALETGYRHIDTAQMYGNEAEIGRAVAASGLKRRDIAIVTKVDPSNLDESRFRDSVRRSIDDLQGVPDLLLVHWPPPDREVDAVIDRLVRCQVEGLAHRVGISNFPVRLMRQAAKRAAVPLVNNQVEFHPLLDQRKVREAARGLGMMLSAYCPLARGKALGEPAIAGIARRLGRPPSEIVLRWIVQQGVAAIPMTRKRDNAASNLQALAFELSEEDMAVIGAAGRQGERIVQPASMRGRWD
jgi:diketogulonate reductase-like aldo/keto reductase